MFFIYINDLSNSMFEIKIVCIFVFTCLEFIISVRTKSNEALVYIHVFICVI